jgi:hypothetical protein
LDPYAVLGVGRSATAAEIRAAYLRRSKELHPDHFAEASPEQRAAATRAMQDLTAAYDMVRDRVEPERVAASPPPQTHTYYATAPPRRNRRLVIIGLAVLALMSGLVLAGSGSSKPPVPDPERADDLSAFKGLCITLEPSGRFKDIVDCTRPHDARVVDVVDRGVPCPIWSDRTLPGSRQDLCLDMVNP